MEDRREPEPADKAAVRAIDQLNDDDDDDDDIGRFKRITPKVLKKLIKDQQLYRTPSLNDKLYLHYHGFAKIEGLEEWTGCARAC